jgi:chemotaxis signal transduction protein
VTAARTTRVLSFVRGGIACAVDARVVRGVSPHVRATRVPGAPRSIRGIIPWRGAIVPLVEAGDEFPASWTAAVIVAGEHGEMALAADSVEGWIERSSATVVLDVDAIQKRLRERIRRGPESEPSRSEETQKS